MNTFFEVYKQKRKDGVDRVSLCSKCGTTKSKVFYKLWEKDNFSRADDDYYGIYCLDCKKHYHTSNLA